MSIRNSNSETSRLWIAIAHVKPNPGNEVLRGALGAFVPVVVLASNAEDVFSKVKRKVNSYEFMLGRIENVEPVTELSQKPMSPELLKLGESLTPENPVALGTFQSYKESPC
jgi:hypothetical protein